MDGIKLGDMAEHNALAKKLGEKLAKSKPSMVKTFLKKLIQNCDEYCSALYWYGETIISIRYQME